MPSPPFLRRRRPPQPATATARGTHALGILALRRTRNALHVACSIRANIHRCSTSHARCHASRWCGHRLFPFWGNSQVSFPLRLRRAPPYSELTAAVASVGLTARVSIPCGGRGALRRRLRRTVHTRPLGNRLALVGTDGRGARDRGGSRLGRSRGVVREGDEDRLLAPRRAVRSDLDRSTGVSGSKQEGRVQRLRACAHNTRTGVQSSPVQSNPVQSNPVQSSPVQSSSVQSNPVQRSRKHAPHPPTTPRHVTGIEAVDGANAPEDADAAEPLAALDPKPIVVTPASGAPYWESTRRGPTEH